MPSQIDMFFRFEDGKEFRVPVIPSEIQINDGSEWRRVNVLGLGEIAEPGYRRPQQISFTSFFPYHYDAGYCQYSDLMHPADASNLFNVAMGTGPGGGGKRPQVVRFIMVEEYEAGVWTTWIDDEFAIDSFQKSHRSGELTDQYYTLTIKSVMVPTLQATGALADNIGTQKPHPVINRSGSDDPNKDVTTGDTPSRVTRPTISPTNAQLVGGVDIGDVSSKLDGSTFVDFTSPTGGSKYSYDTANSDASKWGEDSTDDVTMSTNESAIALGTFLTASDYLPEQITREEYQNNGGTVYLTESGEPF